MCKKVLYEKVAVPTVMYGSESWGMKVTERQKCYFSFKNKYHYTYLNTYIALYHSHAKLPVKHTHTHKQEIVNHPSLGSFPR